MTKRGHHPCRPSNCHEDQRVLTDLFVILAGEARYLNATEFAVLLNEQLEYLEIYPSDRIYIHLCSKI